MSPSEIVNHENKKITIRSACKTDVPLILSFIKELAAYEKMASDVVADVDTLEKSLFGNIPYTEVIIADLNDEPVGFALYFHNFSTFLGKRGLYLEDLFVRASARGHGIGKALLQELATIAYKRDCARMEWWVLNWNKPAIDFYQSLDAEPMDEWTVYRLTGDALIDMAKKDEL